MIYVPPLPFLRRRVRKPPASLASPAPVLVSATYESGTAVTLAFDRAIDMGAFDGYELIVSDADETLAEYWGIDGVSVLSPTTVRIGLSALGPATGLGTTLTASPLARIVAAADGAAWPGGNKLPLPFG